MVQVQVRGGGVGDTHTDADADRVQVGGQEVARAGLKWRWRRHGSRGAVKAREFGKKTGSPTRTVHGCVV